MKRWAFNVAAVASVIMCVATVAIWIRSYFVADQLYINFPQFDRPLADETASFVSGMGGMRASLQRWESWNGGTTIPSRPRLHPHTVVYGSGRPYYPYQLNKTHFRAAGFEISSSHLPGPHGSGHAVIDEYHLVAPCWALMVATGAIPSMWLIGWQRRARKVVPGACVVCGYDLRATPDRCPECGHVARASSP